ncbi:hypothetical protein DdX_17062 [Ditylenchus destructor]|uniref:Uncharacterized protein n=1 Tax=Ditylenchus destructor TaxID=166010 RepID=A0AAD4MMC5_9BILA|nr:hypothetical protein DdX_17062 [Ditylenchus destructor]
MAMTQKYGTNSAAIIAAIRSQGSGCVEECMSTEIDLIPGSPEDNDDFQFHALRSVTTLYDPVYIAALGHTSRGSFLNGFHQTSFLDNSFVESSPYRSQRRMRRRNSLAEALNNAIEFPQSGFASGFTLRAEPRA